MTQNETVLALLQERGPAGVSAAEVIYQHGITRVAARIADLRAAGNDIETIERRGMTATYILKEGGRPRPEPAPVSPIRDNAPAPRPSTAPCPKCGHLVVVSPAWGGLLAGRCARHGQVQVKP